MRRASIAAVYVAAGRNRVGVPQESNLVETIAISNSRFFGIFTVSFARMAASRSVFTRLPQGCVSEFPGSRGPVWVRPLGGRGPRLADAALSLPE